MSLLTLFAKIKFSPKFLNLQYTCNSLLEELCSVAWGATYCRGAETQTFTYFGVGHRKLIIQAYEVYVIWFKRSGVMFKFGFLCDSTE